MGFVPSSVLTVVNVPSTAPFINNLVVPLAREAATWVHAVADTDPLVEVTPSSV